MWCFLGERWVEGKNREVEEEGFEVRVFKA